MLTRPTVPSPTPEPPAPVISIPTNYAIHHFSQTCQCCGSTHEWSSTYIEGRAATRMGAGDPVKCLRPVHTSADLQYQMPIVRTRMAPTTVPFCHQCHEPTIPPDYPEPPKWAARPERAQPAAQPIVRIAKPASGIKLGQAPKRAPDSKRPITLDDL